MNTKEDYLILVIFFTLGTTVAFCKDKIKSAPVAEKPVPVVISKPVPVNLPDWYDRIITQESGGDPNAVSHKGATGLMQIMPKTWADMTHEPYSKATNPTLNKKIGIKYLSYIQKTLRKKEWMGKEPTIEDILASYNAGFGRYRNKGYDLSRMPEETRNYVKKIVDND